jgi:hypothetical protein
MAGDTDKNLLGSELVRFSPVQGPFPDSNRHPAVKTLDKKNIEEFLRSSLQLRSVILTEK